MALWKSSFADQEQQQCATRLLKSWGDDLCPTCMGELSFDHRCDTNDIAIARHTSTVRDVLRSPPLLDTIQSAHAYQRDSTEKPEPINIGPNFFFDAGGQDGSDDESARIQNRNTPLKVKTTKKSRIAPKIPETILALHYPQPMTTNGNDSGNQKRGEQTC
jgi:hypothetical protein